MIDTKRIIAQTDGQPLSRLLLTPQSRLVEIVRELHSDIRNLCNEVELLREEVKRLKKQRNSKGGLGG